MWIFDENDGLVNLDLVTRIYADGPFRVNDNEVWDIKAVTVDGKEHILEKQEGEEAPSALGAASAALAYSAMPSNDDIATAISRLCSRIAKGVEVRVKEEPCL